jgi:hypothetical protein
MAPLNFSAQEQGADAEEAMSENEVLCTEDVVMHPDRAAAWGALSFPADSGHSLYHCDVLNDLVVLAIDLMMAHESVNEGDGHGGSAPVSKSVFASCSVGFHRQVAIDTAHAISSNSLNEFTYSYPTSLLPILQFRQTGGVSSHFTFRFRHE